jgi:PAS domain S-box-containing protein
MLMVGSDGVTVQQQQFDQFPFLSFRSAVLPMVYGARNSNAVADAASRLIAALQHAAIVLHACDLNLRYTWLSSPLFGFEPSDLLGRRDDELLPAETVADLIAFKLRAIAGGRSTTGEVKLPLGGQVRCYEMRATPSFNEDGAVAGLSVAAIDITDRKTAEERMAQAAVHARVLAQATREGLLLHDGERIIETNEAFCRMFHVAREDAIGRDPLVFVAPESRAFAIAQAAVLARGPDELIGQRADGTTLPVEVSVERFEDEGRTLRVVLIRDLTAQKQADAALRDSEERYRALATATREGIIIHDGKRIVEVNETFCTLHGTVREQAIGRPAYDFIMPGLRSAALEAIRSGSTAPYETRARRQDGTTFPIEAAGRPIVYQGRLMRVATIRDLSERTDVEAALRENEERFRDFAEASSDVLWVVDAASGNFEFLSPAYEVIWGETREAVMRDWGRWTQLLHPEDRDRVIGALRATLKGQRIELEYRIVRPDGMMRWIRDTSFPMRGADGEIRRAAGVARDVTRRKENENRQKLLLGELNHRVKNTLATVQSIARQTLRYAPDPATFQERFEDRLLALSQTHNLLTSENWQRASLRSLLKQELSPYGKGRYQMNGDHDVHMAPRAAVALGMALHELTTNAVKYGALSLPSGCVHVDWQIVRADGPRLHMQWSELNGPPIASPPARRGFGSRLLERGITAELGGRVTLDFEPTGLRASIEIPLEAPNVPDD